MVERGDFLEHAEVYGNCYGTSAPWIRSRLEAGQDILLEIDWQGAEQVRAVFPDAIGIFIAPPSIEELERRLRGRDTDTEEVILRRLASARAEIDKIAEYDYIVVNDDFERAAGPDQHRPRPPPAQRSAVPPPGRNVPPHGNGRRAVKIVSPRLTCQGENSI